MRSFDAPTLAFLQSRGALISRFLLWISARDRTTGTTETMGLWSGADSCLFSIGGATRAYVGAGSIMATPTITMATGLNVRMQQVSVSGVSPEVRTALQAYDSRFAPVEMHRALFDPTTMALVSEPTRVLKGFIDSVDLPTPAQGGTATATITVATSARQLTRALGLKRSDAGQSLRGGDRLARYVDVTGMVDVWWGEAQS
jgi:hypothetical protein